MNAGVSPHAEDQNDTRADAWLVGGGEMGKVVRGMDWSKTPLGPIESWPQSLRTTVSLCLASNFPISIAWGSQRVQIYNDGYWPICGAKHPRSMGQDFRECWASAWPVIGQAFERALAGETSFLEDQRMFLDRNGYLEETFFTFSFSPIRDETGGVGGLFHPVTETTSKMVGQRRTRVLRDLAGRAGTAQTGEEALALAAETLSEYGLDIPFALFYEVASGGKEARLASETAGMPECIARPAVDLEEPQRSAWPIAEVVKSNQAVQVSDINSRFGVVSCGPYPEPLTTAMALPISPPGSEWPVAVLVAGVSSRLPLDDNYRAFYDLVAATITSAVATARAYEEERRRAEALAEIDRAKTAFFSNVSHEFRTPLTLMLGPLEDELAEQLMPLPAARRERLETAHRNALRLLKLVNTLLDFSRMEAGRAQASFEPVDLAAYTAELASVFRSAIEKGGLMLSVNCPPLPKPVYVDKEMWEKIVLNLLSNAFKHTFEGTISVTLKWRGDHAELAVADTGVGIAQPELPRLFERFHRVKGARSRTHEGTGIGLALVQELVRAHGGTVAAESKEGKGSTFTVSIKEGCGHLPANRLGAARSSGSTATRTAAYVEEALHWTTEGASDLARASAPQEARGEAGAGAMTSAAAISRPRVLLADDNSDMREYVRRLLAERYEVTAVADGEKAVAAAFSTQPDLVLSDVMMPGLDGFEVLRKLRGDERTRTTPVILLSARAGEESAIEGLEAGADDYLVKPFSARELLARVRTHLDLSKSRQRWALELEAANKELEAFSYSVSHDLRAPLRAIGGFAQLLAQECKGKLPPKAEGWLGHIQTQTQQMGRLIEELLNLSRFGRQELRLSALNMTALAQKVFGELTANMSERLPKFDVQPLLPARADPILIRQVLVNLLSNAIKFTGRTSAATIEIGSQSHGTESEYYVKDNGAGFDARYAARLFGVFQRLHREDEFEGTGVGLALAQRIIRRHGGRIWAEGQLNEGATFHFTLPASTEQ